MACALSVEARMSAAEATMADCKHDKAHKATVSVACFENTGGYMAEIKIECECGRPFQFIGLPLGLDLKGAAMSADGQEARIAIAPVGTIEQPLDKSLLRGFRIGGPNDH